MIGDDAHGRIRGIRERHFNRFVVFVPGVIHHRDTDVQVGHARGEGQGSAGEGVVHPTAGGCTAGNGVVDRDGLARCG